MFLMSLIFAVRLRRGKRGLHLTYHVPIYWFDSVLMYITILDKLQIHHSFSL